MAASGGFIEHAVRAWIFLLPHESFRASTLNVVLSISGKLAGDRLSPIMRILSQLLKELPLMFLECIVSQFPPKKLGTDISGLYCTLTSMDIIAAISKTSLNIFTSPLAVRWVFDITKSMSKVHAPTDNSLHCLQQGHSFLRHSLLIMQQDRIAEVLRWGFLKLIPPSAAALNSDLCEMAKMRCNEAWVEMFQIFTSYLTWLPVMRLVHRHIPLVEHLVYSSVQPVTREAWCTLVQVGNQYGSLYHALRQRRVCTTVGV
ncbi:hypothetical protein ARMGADRAFT_1084390 [Armillaria gallica]|uniref:Uncharacterized protein n=1 Tax=Armillaria gallica TaxID=47427 RepID=A0A2H3DD91_ARMGA|nr:hypothetical protein ARMGADRAFT_1084390 [Armillaria gallica]